MPAARFPEVLAGCNNGVQLLASRSSVTRMQSHVPTMIVGFRPTEYETMVELGLSIPVWLRIRERGRKLKDRPDNVEIYEHSPVTRCQEITTPDPGMPQELRFQVYDAAFQMFRRHYSRITFTRNGTLRSWTNMDNLFHIALSFYYDLIIRNKIETVVFSNFPHEGSYIILYYLAKAMELNVIVCTQSNFPGKLWIVRDIEEFGAFDTVDGEGNTMELPEAPEVPFYMARSGKYVRMLDTSFRLVVESFKLVLKVVSLRAFLKPEAFERNMDRLVQAKDRFRLGSPGAEYVDEVDLTDRFVYFPLHLQPEMTTDTWGFRYGDQLLALEELSAALPEGVKIFAKENPMQTRFMREDSFFQRLKAIPNVYYVSHEVSSFELIRKSLCVATISGTAGWESLLVGRPAIHFGVAWYAGLHGAFRWKGANTLTEALAFEFDRDKLAESFDWLTRKMYSGVLDEAYEAIIPDFDKYDEARKAARSIVSAINATP